MKKHLLLMALCISTTGPAAADRFAELAGEIRLPMPSGWQLGSDSLSYPFQLVRFDPSAELLIFKSEIAPDDALLDKESLRQSVEKVVQEVILTLPEAKLLTSTGYFESYRTGFVIEFTSADSALQIPLRHRLNGVLYRHPDGHQLLFTLWAKADTRSYPEVSDQVKLMQNGFTYRGEQEKAVFASRQHPYGYAAALVILIGGLLYFLRRRPGTNKRLLPSSNTGLWRCHCGHRNPGRYEGCQQCGRIRPGTKVGSDSAA